MRRAALIWRGAARFARFIPLAAGLEAVNEALATAERVAGHQDDEPWAYRNMRDNRAEAFASELREGTHRMSYTARATTPGE